MSMLLAGACKVGGLRTTDLIPAESSKNPRFLSNFGHNLTHFPAPPPPKQNHGYSTGSWTLTLTIKQNNY